MNKKRGNLRVKKTERNSQDKDIIEWMVDEIGYDGGYGISWTAKKRAKPLGEGADIRSKEGVDGVDECVVWTKSTVRDGG